MHAHWLRLDDAAIAENIQQQVGFPAVGVDIHIDRFVGTIQREAGRHLDRQAVAHVPEILGLAPATAGIVMGLENQARSRASTLGWRGRRKIQPPHFRDAVAIGLNTAQECSGFVIFWRPCVDRYVALSGQAIGVRGRNVELKR